MGDLQGKATLPKAYDGTCNKVKPLSIIFHIGFEMKQELVQNMILLDLENALYCDFQLL